MASGREQELEERIVELEEEVEAREKDLGTFRAELQSANHRLEMLIGELNQELKAAHAIQRLLVPTELPNIPGFEFSSKFLPSMIRGGDYFDVFEHEDRSAFGIILASSSGHLMSALLLSVLLKLSGQMEARRGAPPNKMLKMIADEVLSELQGEESADVFYGSFDRAEFKLNYCRVGEMTCLRYDYASGDLKILNSQGKALTAGMDQDWAVESVALNPRDKIIFCTRGIAEAKNLDDEVYGQDRLFRSIHESVSRPVHELRNHILYEVQRFASGQEPPRDMTVVVAEVKDRVIKLAKK